MYASNFTQCPPTNPYPSNAYTATAGPTQMGASGIQQPTRDILNVMPVPHIVQQNTFSQHVMSVHRPHPPLNYHSAHMSSTKQHISTAQIPGPSASPSPSNSSASIDSQGYNMSVPSNFPSSSTPSYNNDEIKSQRDYSATNTSFTGIGISFDSPVGPKNPVSKGKYYCNVCKFDLGSEDSHVKHCQGLMHTQKVAEKEGRRLPQSTSGPNKPYIAGADDSEPKPTVIQNLRDKYPDQYCDVCDTTMTSSAVFEQHLQGARHQKNLINRAKGGPILRGRGNRKLPNAQSEAEENIRCQQKLDNTEEPVIGLQYMTEHTKNNPKVEERYVCDLCNGKCDPRTLLPHIYGTKHRYNYIKLHHEHLIEPQFEAMKTMRKAEKTMLMHDLSLKVYEIEDGPKKMKAKVEIDPFWNPNQEQKMQKMSEKRTKETDGGPPAKKIPKAKVKPNWGGPDPLKRILCDNENEPLDEPQGSSSGSMYHVDEEDGYQSHRVQNPGLPPPAGPPHQMVSNMEPTNSAPAGNGPHNLIDIMKNLSQNLVNNEEEASVALQVSNTLTQALLQYRLRNLSSGGSAYSDGQ